MVNIQIVQDQKNNKFAQIFEKIASNCSAA